MAIIPTLILAAVEYFLTRRDTRQIAEECNVPEDQLAETYRRIQAHSWFTRLAAALADPLHRADTLLIKSHLAHCEEQHGELLVQYQYAKRTTIQVRSMKTYDPNLILKADSLAFRIHQAAARTLRDLQKMELRLEKAEKAAPTLDASTTTPLSDSDQLLETQPQSTSTASSEPCSPDRAIDSTSEANTTEPTQELQPALPQSFPTPEEFKALVFKHRIRIKDTPAKDRPALIARLISQQQHAKRTQSKAA